MKALGIKSADELHERICEAAGSPDPEPISRDTVQRAIGSAPHSLQEKSLRLIAEALDVDVEEIVHTCENLIQQAMVKAISARWKEKWGRVPDAAAANKAAFIRFYIIGCVLDDILLTGDSPGLCIPFFNNYAALEDFATIALLAYEVLPHREGFDPDSPRDSYESFKKDLPNFLRAFEGNAALALGVSLMFRPGSIEMLDRPDALINGELNGMRDFLIFRLACLPCDLGYIERHEGLEGMEGYEWLCETELGIELAGLQGGKEGDIDPAQFPAIKTTARKKLEAAFTSLREQNQPAR